MPSWRPSPRRCARRSSTRSRRPAATWAPAWAPWSSRSRCTRRWTRRGTASSGTSATRPTATSCSPGASTASARSASTGASAGFLRREESEHDIMGAGHASTSISYATGLAEAQRHGRREGRVACVIGDGALTGGMAYEGLNHAGALGRADHGDPQRQRHEHLGERGRAVQALPARAGRSGAHPGARGARARAVAGPRGDRRGRSHPRRHQVAVVRVGGALRGARLRLHRADRRPRRRGRAPRAAHHAGEGPPGPRPRQDGQGQGLPAGRGRRRGHARRHPVRHRERQGGRQGVRPWPCRATRRSSGGPWWPRPSATRGWSGSRPRCSRARACST